MSTQYIVYETATSLYHPIKGLKVEHQVAHYDDEMQMISDWHQEFLDGTHNYFAILSEDHQYDD